MTLGVYDADFKFACALNIIRRYVDRHAVYNQDRTGIVYKQFRDKRVWKQALYADGKPIKTRSGSHVYTPQYVQSVCTMSRVAALQMVADLSQNHSQE